MYAFHRLFAVFRWRLRHGCRLVATAPFWYRPLRAALEVSCVPGWIALFAGGFVTWPDQLHGTVIGWCIAGLMCHLQRLNAWRQERLIATLDEYREREKMLICTIADLSAEQGSKHRRLSSVR